MAKTLERTFRRVQVPIKFSQGFNPHPKISFATALPIGVSSEGEYMDIETTEKVDLEEFINTMNKELPEGLKLIQSKYVNEKSKALMAVIDYSNYLVKCVLSHDVNREYLMDAVVNFLREEKIIINKVSNKRNKEINKELDIRPLIRNITMIDNKSGKDIILKMTLATGSNGNLKPEVVIQSFIEKMNMPILLDHIRIHRQDLLVNMNGVLYTPLDMVN